MKYSIELSTQITIEAKDDGEASKRRYQILEALMNTLLKEKKISDYVVESAWVHSDPAKI